jgi:hypothetical protein
MDRQIQEENRPGTQDNQWRITQCESNIGWTEYLPHLLKGYTPCDVFNADECGLFYNLLPNRTYAFRGEKCHRGKLRKNRITVLVAAKMDGSEKMPLLVIGRSEKKSFPCKANTGITKWHG